MAKINSRLKAVFTSYNLFFWMVGLLILIVGLWNDSWRNTDTELSRELFLLSLYMLGSLTMIFSLLGAYGAHYEHKLSLVMFLVSTIIGGITMMTTGVSVAVVRPQMGEKMEEMFKLALPLEKTTLRYKNAMESMQLKFQCCGVFSYNDWQNHIPPSCLCDVQQAEARCTAVKSTSYSQISRTVYSKPCFPSMLSYMNWVLDCIMGVSFTLTIMAVVGMALSSIMIHQMGDDFVTKPTTELVKIKVPPIFSPTKLPKYEELFNTP